MSFLYPSMFWALTALAIPIAVHLFNFRRHKLVYFSNTAVLKTIQQENAKTRKLKYLVTLLLRCLFIVALVVAFAFPYKKDSTVKLDSEDNLVGIYIDNSMSMKAQSQKTTLIDDARESARNLVGSLSPATRYLLMTNSFEIQNEYPMNQEEMLDQLDRMILDGPPVKMNEVLDRFMMLRKRHGYARATLFAYSDFRRNMFDLSGIQLDSTLQMVVVPLNAEVEANLSIDSVWLSSPVIQAGLANELHVLVTNHGAKEIKGVPINLSMDGKVMASATTDLEGEGSAETVMQLLPQQGGSMRCNVALVDFPITFDDDYGFVIEARPTLKVVEIARSETTPYLSMIFGDDPQYDFERMDPGRIDLDGIAKAQLVVVGESSAINATIRQTLFDAANEGACIAFFHDDAETVDTNAVSVDGLALRHEFFSDIILDLPRHADLPQVHQHVRLMPSANETVLATLANGDPFLVELTVGKGRVYDIATTLDENWSNLADNSLLVPMMLKMALLGGGVGRIAYCLGVDKTVILNDLDIAGDLGLKIRNDDASFEMVPASEVRNNKVCVYFQDALPEAGFYELLQNDSVRHVMAWNDSRSESEMRFMTEDALEKGFGEVGADVMAVLKAEEFTGHDLVQAMAKKSTAWRWFVLFALLALAGEVAVLRFWK